MSAQTWHPDPAEHHPYCAFYRDGYACSCAEGKRAATQTAEERLRNRLHPNNLPLLDEVLAGERRAMLTEIEQRVSKWPKDAALTDFLGIVREATR